MSQTLNMVEAFTLAYAPAIGGYAGQRGLSVSLAAQALHYNIRNPVEVIIGTHHVFTSLAEFEDFKKKTEEQGAATIAETVSLLRDVSATMQHHDPMKTRILELLVKLGAA